MKLTKSQFPDKEWPFAVDTVHVTMKESQRLIVLLVRFNVYRYALNGIAENYHWMPIPGKYRTVNKYSTSYYTSLTWFIKYCLDNVKKS